MDKNMQFSDGLNSLYSNLCTQFMNVQMGVNEKKLTKGQATMMLGNIAKSMKVGVLGFVKAEGVDSYLLKQYNEMFEDLKNQMSEYYKEISNVKANVL